jgi:hypothetical protein
VDESTNEKPDIRVVHLSVHTYNDDKWDHAWGRLTKLTHELGEEYLHVSLTTSRLDDSEIEEGEYFDDQTIIKVVDTIKRTMPGLTEGMAREIINDLHNAGILFRERK